MIDSLAEEIGDIAGCAIGARPIDLHILGLEKVREFYAGMSVLMLEEMKII